MQGEVLSNPDEQAPTEMESTTASTLTLTYERECDGIQSNVSRQQTKRIKMHWASHSSLDVTNSSSSQTSLPDLKEYEEHDIIKRLREHQNLDAVTQAEPVVNPSGSEQFIPHPPL